MPLQLTEGMSTRKRRPNWTDQECLLLAQLMQEKKNIIRGKCSTGVSIQDKRQAWEEIAQAINIAFPQIQRTVSDCNKKWENLLAKSREEIKRQKRQAGTEDLSLEQLSTVTQVVISMMNLSNMLQQHREASSVSELVETQHNSCDEDGNDHTELDLPTYPNPSTPLAEQKFTLTNIPTSLAVQFSAHRAAGFAASAEPLDTPCAASPRCTVHCSPLQERNDLEISVLRRQEAVLKLQEEYYTLKIKQIKKQMEEPIPKD
ncbi:uncharacterized protein AB9X84_010613 isoform 1-T3 [Acanthopagrus schlegelii]